MAFDVYIRHLEGAKNLNSCLLYTSAIRFIVEVAWQAHFVTNMFIQPSAEELESFEPDFVVYNASKAKVENYKELGLNSETCVAFNITSKEQMCIRDRPTAARKVKALSVELLEPSAENRTYSYI